MTNPLSTPSPWNAVVSGYVEETVPLFLHYAREAISRAQLPPKAKVADIAAGPGTLSLLVAPEVSEVVAVDFAPEMLKALKQKAIESNITNIKAILGDGQSLELPTEHYDAAFSMFGLIFFPSRSKGFREMHRILKNNGRALVSSWAPTERVPLLDAMFRSIKEQLPGLPFGGGKAPLGEKDEFYIEMNNAGFQDIEIHSMSHKATISSMEIFWSSNCRGSAPLVLLRKNLGEERWKDFSDSVLARLQEQFGEGQQALEWPALLGVGVK
jgi:ubiquinone/menaquinone biosynthesis C-methylase UbiE